MRTNNQKAKLLHIARMFWEQTDEAHPLTVPQIIEQLRVLGVRAERLAIYDDIQTLRELARNGMTIFLVEQNAHHALKLSDRGYVMVNVQIRLSGSGEELLGNQEVRKAYLGGV